MPEISSMPKIDFLLFHSELMPSLIFMHKTIQFCIEICMTRNLNMGLLQAEGLDCNPPRQPIVYWGLLTSSISYVNLRDACFITMVL